MSKRVICYLLHPIECEGERGDSMRFMQCDRSSYRPAYGKAEPATYIRPVEIEVKIDKHVRIAKLPEGLPQSRLVNPPEWETVDHYFGVEPALEEILRAPYKQELEAAKDKAALEWSNAYWARQEVNQITDTVNAFTEFPWWKRVYLALRGRIQ